MQLLRVVGCLLVLVAGADGIAGTVTVTPDNLGPWQRGPLLSPCSAIPGDIEFVIGPAFPPLGSGSLQIDIGPTSPLVVFHSHTIDGVLLSTLVELRYSTYVSSASVLGTAPRIVLSIATGELSMPFDQLAFIPKLQDGLQPGDPVRVQGPVMIAAWQEWDARVGGWQSLFTFPTAPLTTISSYVAAHPNARMISGDPFGGLAIVAGCDGSQSTANVDAVIVQTSAGQTAFDFELELSPADTPMLGVEFLAILATVVMAIGVWRTR